MITSNSAWVKPKLFYYKIYIKYLLFYTLFYVDNIILKSFVFEGIERISISSLYLKILEYVLECNDRALALNLFDR